MNNNVIKGKDLTWKTSEVGQIKKSFLGKGLIKPEKHMVEVIYDMQEDEYYEIGFKKILNKDLDVSYVAYVNHVENSYGTDRNLPQYRPKQKNNIYTSSDLDRLIKQLKKIKK